VIIADTSAWVEYFRATGSRAHLDLRPLLGTPELATTGVVVMELAAGARGRRELEQVKRVAVSARLLRAREPDDYLAAATIYRACRAGGETIRTLLDCLIAAVAIRTGAQVLHHDRDYTAIARHTPLQLA
jgi:predicted nucleic acid-binding protein